MGKSPTFGSSLFGRLSSGVKMLIILTAALLPLGLIALFASLQAGRAKHLQRVENARVIATSEARQIDILLLRGSNMLRGALAMPGLDPLRCNRLLGRQAEAFPVPIRLALVDASGAQRCGTAGFHPVHPTPPSGGGIEVSLYTGSNGLRFVVQGDDGSFGLGEIPVALLKDVMLETDGTQSITLQTKGARLIVARSWKRPPLSRSLSVQASFAAGQASLSLDQAVNPISAVEILLVLLPILMWAAAAGIGWAVVNRLLLRPLALLQRAIMDHGASKGAFTSPSITTPAQEIRSLADAFHDASVQIANREEALAQGLDRQMRLTREVHHRVKNNLQVVASLINLHSRGANGDVAAAYASIQRRVDALAVVHRNHYAELEQNHGVALRSIVSELVSNLRATAPPKASHFSIMLDMIPAFVTQDVAVPVAFLITEIVELAMACDPEGTVTVALIPGSQPDRAMLVVGARGLAARACLEHATRDRFQRIVTGLSRQLRSQLDYDENVGTHRIMLQIVPQETEQD